jgi:hypothetical protein
VAAWVRRWAGGVTGNGWHFGPMDKGAEPNRRQRRELDELTRWRRNTNPSKRFSLILCELIEHLAIVGDAYLEKMKDPRACYPGTGNLRGRWSAGMVQRLPGGRRAALLRPGQRCR